MAIDNTPPRLKLIITIAVLTIVTLICLDFVFKSYYAFMSDEAIREKLAPPIDLEEQKKAESAALAKANVDQVIAQLGKGPRAELIAAQQSDDLGPMTGWSKMPKPAPVPQPVHAQATGIEGALTVDGGAGDAGAPKGDAGAVKADAGAGAPRRPTGDAGR